MNRLKDVNGKTSASLKKLSSGLQINTAGDDAAGLAISEKMRGQIRGLSQAGRNVQDGISLVQLTDSALGQITDNLQRMRELAVQSANGTLTDGDRQALQQEFGQLIGNIGDIADDTNFNTIKVLTPPPSKAGGSSTSGMADIVFIIDTTGSMGSKISDVKSNIEAFADSLSSRGVDFQLGLVVYGDTLPSQGGNPVVNFPFTNDIDAFKANLDAMPNYGGRDGPESGLESIMDTTKGALTFPFRSSASTQFIVVTDADVHDDMDASNPSTLNIDTVASDLQAADVKTTVVGTIGGTPQTEWEKITTATGGSYFDINGAFSDLLATYADTVAEDARTSSNMPTLVLQVGPNTGDTFKIKLFDARPSSLGIDKLAVDPQEIAQLALKRLDGVTSTISTQRGRFGAYQNALEHIASNVANVEENLTAAESRIRDVDMAKEMTNFQRNNILSQAAQAMVAQANQLPLGVLQLLR